MILTEPLMIPLKFIPWPDRKNKTPSMTTAQLVTLIKQAGRKPVERGTLYNVIRDYSDIEIKEIETNPLLN